jgi:hypothetical protein
MQTSMEFRRTKPSLCLSHSDTVRDRTDCTIELRAGMRLTAWDADADDLGRPDDIFATGIVERAPDWLRDHGSQWILVIDQDGIRHESDLDGGT